MMKCIKSSLPFGNSIAIVFGSANSEMSTPRAHPKETRVSLFVSRTRETNERINKNSQQPERTFRNSHLRARLSRRRPSARRSLRRLAFLFRLRFVSVFVSLSFQLNKHHHRVVIVARAARTFAANRLIIPTSRAFSSLTPRVPLRRALSSSSSSSSSKTKTKAVD